MMAKMGETTVSFASEQENLEMREEIRILLVIRWPVGGIRTFIRYVFSQWSGTRVKLSIVLPELEESVALKDDLAGIDVLWHLVDPGASLVTIAKAVSRALRQTDHDIIHAHGFTSAICAAWSVALHRKIFAIATSHDVILRAQVSGIKGGANRYLLARALNRFDVIHSVSSDAQANLKKMLPGINSKKCTVITNGIETQRFLNAEPRNLRKELALDSNTVLLGFFGRFMAQKGFRYLVDAIEMLNREHDRTFKVACFGWGGFVREEQQSLRARGLENYFIFMPFVSNVAGSMKGIDLLVMPSLWEACPLLPMEALTAGVPLVASRCIGLREVCQDTPTVMIEPGDADSLCQGIIEAVNTPRQRFAEFSQIAAKRYDVSETIEGIRKLYQRAART